MVCWVCVGLSVVGDWSCLFELAVCDGCCASRAHSLLLALADEEQDDQGDDENDNDCDDNAGDDTWTDLSSSPDSCGAA